MIAPKPSEVVANIPAITPFVGPETLERRLGQPFELRLGANESLFGASPLALEAMRRAAADGHFYGDPEGHVLRSRLAAIHHCGIENIVLASGIDELLMLFCRVFVAPGDPVVTTRGSYPTFEYAVRSVGGQIHYVDYSPAGIDLPALSDRATEARPKIVYMANPDNPSATWHSCTSIDEKRFPDESLLLVDEAYAEFAPGTSSSFSQNRVRLRTFSKAHGMAGLRVGYAICDGKHADLLNRVRLHFGVNSIALAGAAASLEDPDFVRQVANETNLTKKWLADSMGELGYEVPPSYTNFVLIDMKSSDLAQAALESLQADRVFIRKPSIAPLDRYIRVTVGPRDTMEAFVDRFKAIDERLLTRAPSA